MYRAEDLKQVYIGRRGEGNARVVEIDVTEMREAYPDAAFSVVMMRSDSGVPILCDTALNGNVLAWAVTPVCTAVAGIHPFEIRAVRDGMVAKSRTGYALVAHGVGDYAGRDVPGPLETWVDMLQQMADRWSELPAPSTAEDLAYILGT